MSSFRYLLSDNKGVALVLTVSVVSLLIAVTVQFSSDTRRELVGSANALAMNTLGIKVKSGYNLAVAVLHGDGKDNESDSLHDSWSLLVEQDLSDFYPAGGVEILVRDLSGRLQLNALAGSADGGNDATANLTREILQRLLVHEIFIDVDLDRAELIINAIVDWIDKDDQEQGLESTESSYYRGLQPSYTAKNGPLEFIEELLLIRGITEEIYYGGKDRPGLKDLVTVHGNDGSININTAPRPLLQAMSPAMNAEFAEDLIAFRSAETNRDQLASSNWFSGVLPGDVVFTPALVRTTSEYFQITVQATDNRLSRLLTADVHRSPDNTVVMIARKME